MVTNLDFACEDHGIFDCEPCEARPTHLVSGAGQVTHSGVQAVVVEIFIAAAKALVPPMCRYIERSSFAAVVVARLF